MIEPKAGTAMPQQVQQLSVTGAGGLIAHDLSTFLRGRKSDNTRLERALDWPLVPLSRKERLGRTHNGIWQQADGQGAPPRCPYTRGAAV
jgi:hypothetical protein